MAQDQQSPLAQAQDGAVLSNYPGPGSFAARMGCSDLAQACHKAMLDGWKVSTGWDHSIAARREVCIITMYSDREKEAWAVGCYTNPKRTTILEDAQGVRALLDSLGIPTARVVASRGDVGSAGKGSAKGLSLIHI